jgi:hypothetical protein
MKRVVLQGKVRYSAALGLMKNLIRVEGALCTPEDRLAAGPLTLDLDPKEFLSHG